MCRSFRHIGNGHRSCCSLNAVLQVCSEIGCNAICHITKCRIRTIIVNRKVFDDNIISWNGFVHSHTHLGCHVVETESHITTILIDLCTVCIITLFDVLSLSKEQVVEVCICSKRNRVTIVIVASSSICLFNYFHLIARNISWQCRERIECIIFCSIVPILDGLSDISTVYCYIGLFLSRQCIANILPRISVGGC